MTVPPRLRSRLWSEGLQLVFISSTVARVRHFGTIFGLIQAPGSASRAKLAIAVLLLGRVRGRSAREEIFPYGFLPFQRKDPTIKPWDKAPRCDGSVEHHTGNGPPVRTSGALD